MLIASYGLNTALLTFDLCSLKHSNVTCFSETRKHTLTDLLWFPRKISFGFGSELQSLGFGFKY